MTLNISPSSPVVPRTRSGPPAAASACSRRAIATRAAGGASLCPIGGTRRRKLDPLGSYIDATGRAREVIVGRRGDGVVLVIDRDALTHRDRRLVAQLAADEPAGNASLVCAHYLRDASRGRCRRVIDEDLSGKPCADHEEPKQLSEESPHRAVLLDRRGCDDRNDAYRLELVGAETSVMELRWLGYSRRGGSAAPAPVCLRKVIGAIESYEPVYGLTLRALRVYRQDPRISGAVLRGELERVRKSPIVLNRRLRQAVLAAAERDGLSMSEIAHRCGRVKRDGRGNASGETSWLARRVGLLPESGTARPTPWIHSDVLALIARNGLGISPREVELG